MSFTFSCPQCDQPIQAEEEMAGLRGRCPHCSTTFAIPDARAAFREEPLPQEAPVEKPAARVNKRARGQREEPAEREGRQDRYDRYDREENWSGPRVASGWRSVRTGVRLVRIGVIIILFAALGFVLVVALSVGLGGRGRGQDMEVLLGIFGIAAVLATLAAVILIIVGQFLCCAAPEEAGVKALAVGSVICLFISLLLSILAAFALIILERRGPFRARDQAMILPVVVFALGEVVGLVEYILFVLFLRGTGRYFRDKSLARSAGSHLIAMVVFFVLAVVFLLLIVIINLAMKGGLGAGVLAGFLGIALAVFGLVLLLWFLDLLGRTAKAIRREERFDWYGARGED